MVAFKATIESDLADLLQKATGLSVLDVDNQTDWEDVFVRYEDLMTRVGHIGSYVGCLTSVDANNEEYSKLEADLSRLGAEVSKLSVELLRALKDATDDVFGQFVGRAALGDAAYALGRMRRDAQFTMDALREGLAADLGVDGIHAWGRLYDTLSGKLEFDMVHPDGKTEKLPMSQRRSLMEKSDRAVRQTAFESGNEAWAGVADVTASALNAIAGTRLTLNGYRGVDHFLDVACFQAAITQKTLGAMLEAIHSEIELGRRILRLKADVMGRDTVAWYDLNAPLPLADDEPLGWQAGKDLVHDSFSRSYPKLGDFVQQMYDDNWVEWAPRAGKRPGAFCTGSKRIKQSRIFMTYNNTIGDVITLAHEAGHAFHSYILREKRSFASRYPMTLAESASTFGEMILMEGIMENPEVSDKQKALTLDMEVGHGAAYLMDIPARFEFEKAFYQARQKGELSVSEIKDLMVETQRHIFGDVLEEGSEDPYFWASKLHFYITGVTFYNYPYTFGFLLSRGLFALFQKEGPDFLPRYEDFLRLTGSDTCENVVKQSIGQDLEKPDFWVQAIRGMEVPLGQLEDILPRVLNNNG
ncbi:MAG: M3 family oligoendopeptidase [Candidatus Latescibacteria bacterium]|nr:M3 family oligoendopeptidase [Candidatus Latescibacterota bacterium]